MSRLQYSDYPGFGQTAKRVLHYSQAVQVGETVEISGQGKLIRLPQDKVLKPQVKCN